MANFINLIQNENMKIYRKSATKIMFIILFALILTAGLIIKFGTHEKAISDNWKQELIAQNKQDQKVMAKMSGNAKNYYQERIAKNDYRIEHDLKPTTGKNIWNFTDDATNNLMTVIILFTIIVVSTSISSEFSWGTIKLLLIRPVSRTSVLLSKYISALIYAVVMILFMFVVSWLIGGILFGFGGLSAANLQYVDGHVFETNWVVYELKQYGLLSITLVMMVTLAAMIASIFRNSALAIGISIFLTMGGSIIVEILSRFDWVKYILFVNMDLHQYINGTPFQKGMTMGFSLSVLAVYFIIFVILGWLFFTKRDVAA